MDGLQAKLEALLFYFGEPISIARAAGVLGVPEEECRLAVRAFRDVLAGDANRGLMLLENGDSLQLVTKPETRVVGEKIIQEEFREELTPAALETLSLVAYLGPVPRSTIDFIRGVNSSFTVRNLVMRGLIERDERNDKGGAYRYRASNAFLEHVGLPSVEVLPDREKYQEIFSRFTQGESAEPIPPHIS